MKLKRFNLLMIGMSLLLLGCAGYISYSQHERYLIYYKTYDTPPSLDAYNLLVLQENTNVDLTTLHPDQTALAYVSIGEAAKGSLEPQDAETLSIRPHDFWDSKLVDVRHPRWQELFLDRFVAAAAAKGFDGIMIDTADSAIHLEQTDPEAYEGMKQALVDLIAQVRARHPDFKIMLNRGFEIWPQVASNIDMLLLEGTLSMHDFETSTSSLITNGYYEQQVQKIRQLKNLHPHLKVYSVDYWDMNDSKGVKFIYQTHRSHGIIPYVSQPLLDDVHAEPLSAYAIVTPLLSHLGGGDA